MTKKQSELLKKLGVGDYVISWIEENRSGYVSRIIDFVINYKKDGIINFYNGISKHVDYADAKYKELKELILASEIRHYNDESFSIYKIEGIGVDNLYYFNQSYIGDWGNFKGSRFGYIIYNEKARYAPPSVNQVWGLGITIMAMPYSYNNAGLHGVINNYIRKRDKL